MPRHSLPSPRAARVRRRFGFDVGSVHNVLESLEGRRLLCSLPHAGEHPIELRPDLVKRPTLASAGAEPAQIIWTNRATTTAGGAADTDRFGVTFGTGAPAARAVVDAVIDAYERMIGSFNYATAGATYSLSLSMNTSAASGHGASASLSTLLAGKPKGGSITMGTGNGSADPNDFNNWFMDPTPYEHSEFQGNITNAFSGDAHAGSPASGKGDFYTVVAAEMTHCMGMSSGSGPLWTDMTTNTGIPDTAEGGGVGKFWVFQGPSIKHLLTSNNGGPGGQERTKAVHGAGPNVPISWNGETYIGAQDQGNAVYEFSRRYLINNTFSLMFKDAYAYSSVDPAKFGTFYSVLNATTKVVNVRGGDFVTSLPNNNDTISITREGDTIFVSVDPTADVPGTGHLPGHGNLPAFVSEYDISQVSQIMIDSGGGNDTIVVGSNLGVTVQINGGAGTDSVTFVGTDSADTINVNSGGITSGATTASIFAGAESMRVNGLGGGDTITVASTSSTLPITIDGGEGTDTLNVQGTFGGLPVSIVNSAGSDIVNVNTDNTSIAEAVFNSTMRLGALNVGAGGLAGLLANGTRVLTTGALSINATGRLDLFDNAMVVDYGASSPIGAVQGWINSARAGGAWTGNGLTSTTARNATPSNRTLAAIEAADFDVVYGADEPFQGEAVDSSAVLVKFTYYGDTDFNGRVNFDDYSRLDAGFLNGRTGWFNGDLNGDGAVNFDDYALIDNAFLTQAPAGIGLRAGGANGRLLATGRR